ncbi:MAG: hypothetical protein ACOC0H_03665 [Thermodesulfobacteriota bacterium]
MVSDKYHENGVERRKLFKYLESGSGRPCRPIKGAFHNRTEPLPSFAAKDLFSESPSGMN